MSKCLGCGVKLQSIDKNKNGYAPHEGDKYCQRCFKLTNYHENEVRDKVLLDDDILMKINRKNYFTFFLVDIFNLNEIVIKLYHKITCHKVLVLTKVDSLPKNIKYNVLKENIKRIYNLNDVILFSKVTGFGKNDILSLCQKFEKVVFAGPTSSGKSSLINYLFNKDLTVSEYRNTTYDFISLPVDDMLIIDAPGFNGLYDISESVLKKPIIPKTISLKIDYALYIDNLIIKSKEDCNLSLYFPESVKIITKKCDDSFKNIKIDCSSDIVVRSKGFIYSKNGGDLEFSNLDDIEIRESVVKSYE